MQEKIRRLLMALKLDILRTEVDESNCEHHLDMIDEIMSEIDKEQRDKAEVQHVANK